jgi:hypothetical protein
MQQQGYFGHSSDTAVPTVLPLGRRHCTCNSVQRKIVASSSPGTSREGGSSSGQLHRGKQAFGYYFRFPLHNKATFKKILFPRTKQNKKKIPRRGERHHFLWIRWGFSDFFFYGRFFFFPIFPRMERSEKNKINHLSIVFSGMSSVSLGWGIKGMGRREWEEAETFPQLPLLDPLVSFSPKAAEGYGRTAGREQGDGKSQLIKGLLLGPRGAVRTFHGTVLGNEAL